jgi:hypothetical protein
MLISEMVNAGSPAQVVDSLPDAHSLAADALAQALEYCAQKLGLRDGQAALACLKEGDHAACQYCAYSLAQRVAQAIGAWDEYVQSVYVIDYDATPDDLCFACEGQFGPIHVIVWTARKTRALDALIAVLDRAFTQRYRGLVGCGDLEHMLDVQVIDDADVESRIGYGAMLASIHQRPVQVWSR